MAIEKEKLIDMYRVMVRMPLRRIKMAPPLQRRLLVALWL